MGIDLPVDPDDIEVAAFHARTAAESLTCLTTDQRPAWNAALHLSALKSLATAFGLASKGVDGHTARDTNGHRAVFALDGDQVTIRFSAKGIHDLLGVITFNNELFSPDEQPDNTHETSPSVVAHHCACEHRQLHPTGGEPHSDSENELLTADEAARLLKVSRRTLLRATESGELTPAHKLPGIRGAFLFTPTSIAKYAKTRGLPTPTALADSEAAS